MKYRLWLVCFLALTAPILSAQQPYHTLYLIGDGGKDEQTNPIFHELGERILKDSASTVILLGDNIYPDGLDEAGKQSQGARKLIAQLRIFDQYKGHVYVVPGNHDWAANKWSGLAAVRRQALLVEDYLEGTQIADKEERNFGPDPGFPGPVNWWPHPKVQIIAIDLQWWLQRQFFHPVGGGPKKSELAKQFFARLDSLLAAGASAGARNVIVAHHPLYTNGHHGAPKQPLRFLINWTPLQIFGIIGLNRMLSQDIPQPRYKRLRNKLLPVLNQYPNTIFAAGHEHALQYFYQDQVHHIVSGCGSKLSSISKHRYPDLYRQDKELGYFIVELFTDGTQRIIPVLAGSGEQPEIR